MSLIPSTPANGLACSEDVLGGNAEPEDPQRKLDCWDRTIPFTVPKDLKDIVQEVIDLPAWSPGSALTILLINAATDQDGANYESSRSITGFDPARGPEYSPSPTAGRTAPIVLSSGGSPVFGRGCCDLGITRVQGRYAWIRASGTRRDNRCIDSCTSPMMDALSSVSNSRSRMITRPPTTTLCTSLARVA